MANSPNGLAIRVTPGAKKDALEMDCDDLVKIRLRARAIDGKANAALIRFLADTLNVPARDVSIRVGEHSRNKVVQVRGVGDLKERLAALAGKIPKTSK